ncbi:MAG TPA: HIT domain-containing protein [Spongiibacteraceae bacterium]|nr:HIT domain-containing protein [Spongiibacteraceae bacterium]
MFELHTQLAKDCVLLGDLPLCRVLLMNDALYPWLILVPRREQIAEIFQLSRIDQQQLMDEASSMGSALAGHFRADKMNVAALGNMVPQLHLHVIVRYRGDTAWPRPVWGVAPAELYSDELLAQRLQELQMLLVPLGLQWGIGYSA